MKTDFDRELDEIFGDTTNPQGLAEARLAIEIAVQFAALRERRGLSQKQLAERLGKTQQAISKIENPSHGGHSLARLKDAVAAMDADLDVTIVPREDAEAYRALYPPKPVLEAISQRLKSESRSVRRPPIPRCRWRYRPGVARIQGSLRPQSETSAIAPPLGSGIDPGWFAGAAFLGLRSVR